jgi:hypothetical protein
MQARGQLQYGKLREEGIEMKMLGVIAMLIYMVYFVKALSQGGAE